MADEFDGWTLEQVNAESDRLDAEKAKLLARKRRVAAARKKLLDLERVRQVTGRMKPETVAAFREVLRVTPGVAESSARASLKPKGV